MAEEKCFCHLNGYEVKDAKARRDLQDLKEWKEEADRLLDYLEERETSNEADHINFNDNFIQIFDALAEGGGTKLYRHFITIEKPYRSGYTHNFKGTTYYYSSDPTPYTQETLCNIPYLSFNIEFISIKEGGSPRAIPVCLFLSNGEVHHRAVKAITSDAVIEEYAGIITLPSNMITITDTVTEV